jgi:hypothetical protein
MPRFSELSWWCYQSLDQPFQSIDRLTNDKLKVVRDKMIVSLRNVLSVLQQRWLQAGMFRQWYENADAREQRCCAVGPTSPMIGSRAPHCQAVSRFSIQSLAASQRIDALIERHKRGIIIRPQIISWMLSELSQVQCHIGGYRITSYPLYLVIMP